MMLGFVLRPWLRLVGPNWYRPLPGTSASILECSNGHLQKEEQTSLPLSAAPQVGGTDTLLEIRRIYNRAFPLARSISLKGRQAEFYKCQATRLDARRILSFTWHPISQRLHPMFVSPPPRRPCQAAVGCRAGRSAKGRMTAPGAGPALGILKP